MSMLLDSSGIATPLRERVRNGFPVFGTCAGDLLAEKIIDGRADQQQLVGCNHCVMATDANRQFEASITVVKLTRSR